MCDSLEILFFGNLIFKTDNWQGHKQSQSQAQTSVGKSFFFNHMQQADTKRELCLKWKSKSMNHQWNQNLPY